MQIDEGGQGPELERDGDDADHADGADHTDGSAVLPWYRNPWNLAALLLAVLVLAATGGFVVGERNATPDPNRTDIGFLQDMRAHHEQGVEMGLAYLATSGTDPVLDVLADEIVFGQSIEIGRMIQLLRDYGKAEANETGTAMAWMGESTPLQRMPGLATEDDLASLRSATGADADHIFATLMIAHHRGGIHMAEYAAAHGGTREVRDFAAGVVAGQRDEVAEMQKYAVA